MGILENFSLAGKVALVTGASQGLGQGIAKGLAEAGADIFGVAVNDLSETQSEIEARGRRFVGMTADLSDSSIVTEVVARALDAFGDFHILVNNAGIIRRADALDFSEQDWDDVMNLNLKTLFFLSQQAARTFIAKKHGGKIINIASMLSFQGGIRVPSYTASKSGVRGLTMLMANEWAHYGIQVNAIAPGYMETSNTAALRQDAQRSDEILARIPAGRWGQPDDLAGTAVFLASQASDYVQGYTIAVDGGFLAR